MNGPGRLVAHPIAVRVAQVALGVLFIVAALAKLQNPAGLAAQVHNFRLVPIPLENLIAIVLPWVELTAAVALVLGIRGRAGAMILTVLLAGFTVGVAIAMARGLDFECGCFGTADATRIGWTKLGQNLLMLLVGVAACLRPRPAGLLAAAD